MAQWTNYWKIVTPASRKSNYQALQGPRQDQEGNGYASFSNVAWFSNIMRGAQTRLALYKQYDAMDSGDVNRALDIIAEEMTTTDKRTSLPFVIDYQTEENQNVSDTTTTTLRAALRHWSNFHKLHTKVFKIARIMIKYGDCFLRKVSDTKPWEYVDPTRVVGIEIDEFGEKISYHIKPKINPNTGAQEESIEIVPASAILHFSLSDDMGGNTPFGESLLQPVFRDWQKLQMLQDASIIYKIVRAPERRVFYIDVGNMAPQRVKQYLEQIRNEIRQRRIPNAANGNQTDGQYNPESIQEDYYFPVTAAGRGSRVETLPGGQSWDMPEMDFFQASMFRALRVPTSYMRGSDAKGTPGGAQTNDGKVGIAYMEELRFALFVMRHQIIVEEVLDKEFKTYLAVAGINIDNDIFKLSLPEPQNFALYRQAALDADLINAFKAIEDTPYISKRMMLKRYLGWTEDDIQMNETMLKQERSIEDFTEFDEVQQIYDPAIYGDRKVNFEEPSMGMGGGMPTGGMEPQAPEVPPPPIEDSSAPPEEGGGTGGEEETPPQ
jgi:hypothetical protein